MWRWNVLQYQNIHSELIKKWSPGEKSGNNLSFYIWLYVLYASV